MSLNFTHKKPETDKYFNYHLDYYIISNVINIPFINKCVFLLRNDIDNIADYHINNKDIIKI